MSTVNKAKKLLIKMLVEKKYDSDPVKAWKESLKQVRHVLVCHVSASTSAYP